jgi:hypothetical protein
LQSLSGLASYFDLDKLLADLSGFASSTYLDQTSCILSLDWLALHIKIKLSWNLSLDYPTLFVWIKLLAISLWIGQLSIPGLNFL